MAQNDFFVIAYRILNYLDESLKAGMQPQIDVISANSLGIKETYWANIMRMMAEENLITGVNVEQVGSCPIVTFTNMSITIKGLEYLEENHSIRKAKEFLKSHQQPVPVLTS